MSFTTGSTPFGTFDADTAFAADADRIVDFVRRKLGEPVIQVHLSSSQIYAAFEEAAHEYSAVVNQYQAKSVLASFLGAPTGSLTGSEQRYPYRSLELQRRLADGYAAEAGLNGPYTWYTGSITLQTGVQRYDLKSLWPVTGSDGLSTRMRVKDIFHFSPLSAYRFFGTTSAMNYLHNQFNFESFTPETIFYLLPIWEDILRGMQFETSNRVRRSQYSFEIRNNVLTIYPVPTSNVPLFFTYTLPQGPLGGDDPSDRSLDGVANIANIPFGNIRYSNLNSVSKHWIRRMAFALAKEVEGQIRGKFTTVPIPNGDLTLNGPELISDARAEQDSLRTELREILEETTYQKLMEREAELAENLNRAIKDVPLLIYVGVALPFFFPFVDWITR